MRSISANRRASILSLWLPSLMEAFFRGSHTSSFVTCGFSKSYNQAAEVPSSNVTRKSPRSPSINCRIMLAFVSMTHSITIFPEAFMTALEILSLCTSIPIYLVLVIKGCSFLEGLSTNTQNLLQKGRPLYCVGKQEVTRFLPVCSSLGNNRQEGPQIRFEEGLSVIPAKDYSYLSASMGSTRLARRAGTSQAA